VSEVFLFYRKNKQRYDWLNKVIVNLESVSALQVATPSRLTGVLVMTLSSAIIVFRFSGKRRQLRLKCSVEIFLISCRSPRAQSSVADSIGVRRGVSKRVEDGRRPPAL
jgi:hypothetical protein